MKTMISRTGFAFLMLGMPVYGQTAVGTTVATTVGTTAASAYSGKISGTVLDETGKAMAGRSSVWRWNCRRRRRVWLRFRSGRTGRWRSAGRTGLLRRRTCLPA